MSTPDCIAWLRLALVFVPLEVPASDAKVYTGRQKPLTQVAVLFAHP